MPCKILLSGLWLPTLLSALPLSAQSFHFERIGAAEGLSQGMVYDLMQCSNGFLWVATKDGLNRYDGYGFQVFQHDPFNPFTLSDNEVKVVMEDSRGRIWTGTLLSGLNILDPQTGCTYQIEGLPSLQVNAIAEAPDRSVWVGTEAGVNRIRLPEKLPSDTPKLSPAATQLETILWAPGIYAKTYAVIDIAFDAKGTAWVSTNEHLGVFDTEAQQLKIVWKNTALPDKEAVTSFIKPTADGTVWVGQLNKLLRFREGKVEIFPLPHRSAHPYIDMTVDAAGDMYVSNRKYIFKFKQPDKASPGSADIETIYRFPEKGIIGTTKLLIDRSGLLWVGTNGYGLLKQNPGNPHFYHYLAGKSPRRIHVDHQNRVWVWNSGLKFGLLDKKNNLAQVPLLTEPQYHQHDCISTPDGALWVLCESNLAEPKKNGLLIKLDGHSLKVLAKYSLPMDVGMFGRLFSDKKGNLWALGTKSTLLRFDPTTIQTEVHDFSAVTGYSELALSFHISQDGHYWIGTPHGLLRATPRGNGLSYERFVNAPHNPNSLNCNYILCAIDDPQAPERYCWMGTRGGGISRLDKMTGQFKNYTTAEGLPNNVVYGILPETSPAGAPTLFWLSTNRGLSQFDPNTGLCQNYFSTDGLQDNEFNTISFAKAADGQLYFGGVNGITAFYPSEVKSANKAAEVQLTNFLVNNKPLLPLGIALHDRTLQLQHQQNHLTFTFAAIDFATPQMNQYRYRLIGVDRDWVEATTKNSATYVHLDPGEYVFEVITGGSRGTWSQQAAHLSVKIHPPWHQTGWAYAIYSVLAALGAWSFYRFQMNRVRLKNKLKYEQREAARLIEIDKLKTDFFSSITHELRTPITLLLEPAHQLLHETSNKNDRFKLELIEGNAKKLLHFVNQILDLSKLDAGQLPMNLKAGNPVSAAKAVFAQFQPLAEQRSMRLSAQWPPETDLVNYDEGKWEQIVSNLLSNAIKFTGDGGQVSLKMRSSISDADGYIDYELTVTDNGSGIAPEDLPKIFDRFYQTKHNMSGTGIGLALCKELLERMSGSIRVNSSLGKGSVFTVTMRCECLTVGPVVETKETALLPAHASRTTTPSDLPLLLLIEDNKDLRQFLRKTLSKNYHIAEAPDGMKGIEMTFKLMPDLVVTDLLMPQKDGFEVVHKIKSSLATSHIPIILLTGQSTQETKLKSLRFGADVYLTKPFDSDELQAHIENLLASRRRLQAYFSQESPVISTVKQLSAPENEFLQKLIQLIEENLDNDDMDAEAFAKAMFVSRSQLHRKISALTGIALTEFVRNYRLDRAKEMLEQNEGSVSEIAWRVGFQNAKYFSTSFKERFGQTPSSVAKKGSQL